MMTAQRELLAGLETLYTSREWSDLVLVSRDGVQHSVHRAIVCPRSRYLYDAVTERRWKDGIDSHIALPDDDDNILQLVIDYLYRLDYNAEQLASPLTPSTEDETFADLIDEDENANVTDSPRDIASYDEISSHSSVDHAGRYGLLYGTSAVSAFGGPGCRGQSHSTRHSHHQHHPPNLIAPLTTSSSSCSRRSSLLTAHALPSKDEPVVDFATFCSTSSANSMSISRAHNQQSALKPTLSVASRRSYSDHSSPCATRAPCLTIHARIYAAAERFQISGLQALALERFQMQLTRHWDSAELAACIPIIFSTSAPTTPWRDMRAAVADTLARHPRLLDKPDIEAAVVSVNGLAYELLKRSRRGCP